MNIKDSDRNNLLERLKLPEEKANGGRIGFAGGTTLRAIASEMNDGRGPITRGDYIQLYELAGYDSDVAGSLGTQHYKTGFAQDDVIRQIDFATGGRVGLMKGAMPEDEDEEDSYRAGVMQAMAASRKKAMGGGMMEIPTGKMRMNQGGVMERDYRDEGGFVPVGIKEKADDVPAMLSKNEFVMTADAVRGAGGGSIEKGAQRMYDTMKSLEKKVG